ncbi:MAG: sugar ABC transporter substrate-binding protein [Eubacteriales bacterium]|nr:sugar ABC transporter substrate-binding protein [Eubacteriales bacterium]
MKKKVLSALLAATMVVGSMGSMAVLASESGDEEVTLNWALWDEKTATYWSAVADAYMAENPNVTIEMTDLGSSDYMTVLATDLSGDGSDFDIVTIKDVPGYATLVSKGVLENLNDRIEADGIDLSVYNGTTEQVTADGNLYELPFRSDFWVLYYNKRIFDEAGVDYPTNDMTMEEYDELARSVTKQGFGNDQIYGAHYHTWRSAVQLFGILDGEHTVLDGNYDFTKPYYEMVINQANDGVCRSYVDTNASQLHYSGAFSEGNTATMNMGSWYITTLISELASGNYDADLVGDWGIVKYPHPEGVEAGTTLGTITALAIPTSSENKDAAWDFIKFACGEEGAKVVASTGTFPAIMNDDVIAEISSLEGFPQDDASKEALRTAQLCLEAPYDTHITEINTVLDTYHKDIMNGDISIDDGIAKMNEEVGKILGE